MYFMFFAFLASFCSDFLLKGCLKDPSWIWLQKAGNGFQACRVNSSPSFLILPFFLPSFPTAGKRASIKYYTAINHLYVINGT